MTIVVNVQTFEDGDDLAKTVGIYESPPGMELDSVAVTVELVQRQSLSITAAHEYLKRLGFELCTRFDLDITERP